MSTNRDVIPLVFAVPANIYKVTEDLTVNEGANVTLSCLASGRPDPAINWRLLNPSGKNPLTHVLVHLCPSIFQTTRLFFFLGGV